MSDRDGTLNTDGTLAAALRALPDAAPQPDLWPALAQSLQQRRRRPRAWRYALPAALAAGIAFALLLPRTPAPTPQAPVATTSAATASAPQPAAPKDDLAELRRRSQALQDWIGTFAANAPQDSRGLMAAVEIEDLIGLIDMQLDAARGPDDALPLWRQRVALLEELATVRSHAYAVAVREEDAVPSTRRL
jgi:hypothetical protein